ncbi:MAG: stage III sporulation protein AF [Eubacteriales bacterium]
MDAYVNTLLTVSVICGIINSFLPSSEKSLKKYAGYLMGLVMAVVILSPLSSFVGGIGSVKENIKNFTDNLMIEEKTDNANKIIVNATEKSICDKIKNMLISKYNFEDTDVYVSLETEESNEKIITIKKVVVTLTNKASWSDADRIKSYLENMIGCDVSVSKK